MALLLTGCAIEKFVKPPWSAVVINHERFYGLNASIPYSGEAILKVQLGWGSHTWTVLPVNTNKVFVGQISDTFRLGQELSPFSTTITEDIQAGWEGAPPQPRYKNLFTPDMNTNSIAAIALAGLLSGCGTVNPAYTNTVATNTVAQFDPANTNQVAGLSVLFPSNPPARMETFANAAGAVKKVNADGTVTYIIARSDLNDENQTAFIREAIKCGAQFDRIIFQP